MTHRELTEAERRLRAGDLVAQDDISRPGLKPLHSPAKILALHPGLGAAAVRPRFPDGTYAEEVFVWPIRGLWKLNEDGTFPVADSPL